MVIQGDKMTNWNTNVRESAKDEAEAMYKSYFKGILSIEEYELCLKEQYAPIEFLQEVED